MKMKKIWAAAAALLMLTGCSSKYAGGYTETADTNGTIMDNASPSYNTGTYPGELPENSSEKLVYSGSLSIESKSYTETVEFLRSKVQEYHGIIEYEEESTGGYDYYGNLERGTRYLNMTLRIPSENFYTFIEETEGGCVVTQRSANVENITQQYNDVSIMVEALEKQERALLDMMDQASTIEEMIQVESRLSDVQTQLNQVKSRLNAMDTDVAYSTLDIYVREVSVYSEKKASFFEELQDRFVNGFASFGDFLRNLVLAAAYLFPYLITAGVLLVVGVYLKKKGKLPRFPGKKKAKEKDHTIV